jgi:iron only hydrogenase large subunit-like protein
MPCYDKKLEASRQDFHNEIYSTRDVDCVITTGELELMMREKGWDLSVPVQDELEPLPRGAAGFEFPELMSHPGTSSGSYLHSLIDMHTITPPDILDLFVRTVRSSDYEEYTLKNRESGEIVFKGAKCYGFRNLQNVVRKVGREAGVQSGKGPAGSTAGGLRARMKKRAGGKEGEEVKEKGYDYVEVMACPGGCVNGGGQLKPPTRRKQEDAEGYQRNWEDSGVEIALTVPGGVEGVMQNAKWGDKEWTKRVEEAYWHDLSTPPVSPTLSSVDDESVPKKADRLAAQILVDMCRPQISEVDSAWGTLMDKSAESRRRALFRTQYKAVESEIIGLAVKW